MSRFFREEGERKRNWFSERGRKGRGEEKRGV